MATKITANRSAWFRDAFHQGGKIIVRPLRSEGKKFLKANALKTSKYFLLYFVDLPAFFS